MENKPYDPKLRAAMREIRLILAKHDIGGAVCLGSKTHGEFADIPPQWCTIKAKEDYLRLRLPVKSDRELANASLFWVLSMRDQLVHFAGMYLQRTDAIDKMMKARRAEYYHTPMHNLVESDTDKNKTS